MPAPRIQLRPATEEDFEFIHALRAEAYRGYVERHFGSWVDAEQREYLRQQWPTRSRRVVQLFGEPVGYLGTSEEASGAKLGNIILRPSARGRGIATRVLSDWLIGLDERGLTASLSVFRDNPAVALYPRLGFEVVSVDPPHLRMVRPARGGAVR